MAHGLNKVHLIGYLGRDATVRVTPRGPVAVCLVGTTEEWMDAKTRAQQRVEWHTVVMWGRKAETLHRYLVKGKELYVEGRLRTRAWDDESGAKRTATEIHADTVILLPLLQLPLASRRSVHASDEDVAGGYAPEQPSAEG